MVMAASFKFLKVEETETRAFIFSFNQEEGRFLNKDEE